MRAYERARAIKTRFVSKKRFNLDFCKSTIAATLAEAEAEAEAEAAAATAAALVEVTAAEVAAEAEIAVKSVTVDKTCMTFSIMVSLDNVIQVMGTWLERS